MRLYLGVVDVPYADAGSNTTGDVAQILEARYGIMEKFVEMRGAQIAEVLNEVMQGKLENQMMGAPLQEGALTAEGDLSEIEEMFREALDREEFNGLIPGVPTQAALRGINHRLKRPYVKANPPRPSFIDSGLFQSSVRVWLGE